MSNSSRILIVEDDNNLGDTLFEYLQAQGHEVELAKNIQAAREKFRSLTPEIVLMDIELPDGNGIELAKELRQEHKNYSLLFLSAQNDPEIKVEGFEAGAEDYITKPFAIKELLIRLDRIKSFQQEIASDDEIVIGSLKIWFKRFEVQDGNGDVLPLSHKECSILKLLWSNQNNAVDRDQIIDKVWGENKFPSQRTVDNYIVKLRKWCETDTNGSVQIQSIRGIGYKLIINK